MKQLKTHDMEDLLRGSEAPAPPEGLLKAIQDEIPEVLPATQPVPVPPPAGHTFLRHRTWLAAATVVVALGAGVVGLRSLREIERPASEKAPRAQATPAVPVAPTLQMDAVQPTESVNAPEPVSAREERADKEQLAGQMPAGSTAQAEADKVVDLPEVELGQLRARGYLRQEAARATAKKSPKATVGRSTDAGKLERRPTGRVAQPLEERQSLPSAPVGKSDEPEVYEESITVTSESPLLDERKISVGTMVTSVESESVPTARDPWVVAQSVPGVLVDKTAVDSPRRNLKAKNWAAEGVTVTDPRAIAASPSYDQSESYEGKAIVLGEVPKPMPSTGGTAEPNDAAYGDLFHRSYGVNPFIDTEDDALSTFALDVDTGSYTQVRRFLRDGVQPPPAAVRVEEMVNYFDYGDRAPREGQDALSITLEGAPTPFVEGERYRLLRVGIQGREAARGRRDPALLIFVVDVSGSMERENRLGLVKRALALLLGQLGPEDRVGLVVYGDRGRVVLEPTSDLESIRSAVDSLRSGGSTNAEEGLVLAYDQAERHLRPGAINRIILCSDGVANVGATGPGSILDRIGAGARRGIELTTVGFGMGNYNDTLMEQLADRGNGNYAYVDELQEARRIFVENLTGTLQTLAFDSKVQVEFDERAVSRYRLLGYENRDVADEDFRNDAVDAGEIGVGHSVTALYEIKLTEAAASAHRGAPMHLATVRLRYRPVGSDRVVEKVEEIGTRDLARSWSRAKPSLRLAAVVAEFAEILRGSYWAKTGDLTRVLQEANKVAAAKAGDGAVAEFAEMVSEAVKLQPTDP